MDQDFWLSSWRDNRIAFHEGRPNRLLAAHATALGAPAGGRIFVPLAGKSQDMVWLRARGYAVLGVEMSGLAVDQFFTELGVEPKVKAAGDLQRYEVDGLTLFAGDIFALDPATLGPVDAVYDRAALVALPEPLRRRYAAHLVELTRRAPQLLVTFEYDQTLQPPPPFAMFEADVRAVYDAAYELTDAGALDIPGGLKGLCPAQERVWLLGPRP